jgi:hypothetical protein
VPFCRECGKEVQADWVTCPYCSQPIGPPATQQIGIQDSVVIGDVSTTVNDPKSISMAMKSASECTHCGSIGSTQIACLECKKCAYCTICQQEVFQERKAAIGRMGIGMAEERYCVQCFESYLSSQGFEQCTGCQTYVSSSFTCYYCKTEYCSECKSYFQFGGARYDTFVEHRRKLPTRKQKSQVGKSQMMRWKSDLNIISSDEEPVFVCRNHITWTRKMAWWKEG